MNLRIDHAQPDDAPIIAQMVGELLREITAMVGQHVWFSPGGDGGVGSILDDGWEVQRLAGPQWGTA